MNRLQLAGATSLSIWMLGAVAPFGAPAFAQNDQLPDRSTLLRSDDTGCDGVMIVVPDIEYDDEVLQVQRGQSRVFRVDNENVRWACIGRSETRSDTMECPTDTTHLRIDRRDDVAVFECYGRGPQD